MTEPKKPFRSLSKSPAPKETVAFSITIQNFILSLPEFHKAKAIGLFSARSTEPNVSPLWEKRPKACAFPKVSGSTLQFFNVSDLSELRPGFAGIAEPPGESMAVQFKANDLVLVPGIHFDRHGARIGSGKGFYDRFLASLPSGVVFVGVCWSKQVSNDPLPQESHDIRVHYVCNEAGLLRCH